MPAENMLIVGMNEEHGQVQMMLYGAAFLTASPDKFKNAQLAAQRIALSVNTLADYTDEELTQNVVVNAFVQGANHALNQVYAANPSGRRAHQDEMDKVVKFVREQGFSGIVPRLPEPK